MGSEDFRLQNCKTAKLQNCMTAEPHFLILSAMQNMILLPGSDTMQPLHFHSVLLYSDIKLADS
jgi:hypothetical protein